MAKKTVLHADDVSRWREYVRGLLADSYDVISVDDCDSVLETLQQREVDLVILDHLMPSSTLIDTGYDVGTRIRQLYPETKFVVFTGAWEDVRVNRQRLEEEMGAPVIFKDGDDPQADDLLARVAELL